MAIPVINTNRVLTIVPKIISLIKFLILSATLALSVHANAGCKGSFMAKGSVGQEVVDVKLKYVLEPVLNKEGYIEVFALLTNDTPYYKSVDISDVGLSLIHKNTVEFRLSVYDEYWSFPKNTEVRIKLDSKVSKSLSKLDEYAVVRVPIVQSYSHRYTDHKQAESAYFTNNLRPIDKCKIFEDMPWIK